MKNVFILIIFLNFVFGFSQNSELIILKENDTLESSNFNFWIKTKDDFLKFNDANKLLYDNLILESTDIISVLLISKNDTLNFKVGKKQNLTFEKDNLQYKTLSLAVSVDKNNLNFDFEFCKKNNCNITINLVDKEFKKIFSEFMIGLENPKSDYDKEFTSKHKVRQKNKKSRKRKRELKKYFKKTRFITLAFGNNIIFEQIAKVDDDHK